MEVVMYIPKLRNAEQVVQYFKQADYDTAVSVYLLKSLARRRKIMCRFIGKKRLFNLDECLQYFTGSFRYEKIRKVRGSARKMRGTFEILNIFKESDSDTILCKMIIILSIFNSYSLLFFPTITFADNLI